MDKKEDWLQRYAMKKIAVFGLVVYRRIFCAYQSPI